MDLKKYTEYSFLENMAQELIKHRKNNYSQQSINYYLAPDKFFIEDISQICNRFNHKLKCTLIKHTNTVFEMAKRNSTINSKCIIYLHGLGSNRLQAFSILPYIPKSYCLLAFDMSGSGKSQGENTTYGYRQKDDIQSIIEYLYLKKKLKSFILWGRSMGAVATLLYAISLNQTNQQNQQQNSKMIKQKIKKQSLIKCIVIDSPFYSFQQIAKQIGLKKLSVPKFISQIALKILNNLFQKLLYSKAQDRSYNPFKIVFDKNIQTFMPAIFIHSLNDQIVPYYHSQKIIQLFQNKFQKITVPQCGHNINRPSHIIQLIFQKLNKFIGNETNSNQRKYSLNAQKTQKDLLKQNKDPKISLKKRGISVYTSIQKSHISPPKKHNKKTNSDLQETKKKISQDKLNLSMVFKRRRTSDLKLKIVNSMKNLQNQFIPELSLQTICYDNKDFSLQKSKQNESRLNKQILNSNFLKTIDVDMQGIINKKMEYNFGKKQDEKISRIYREKRIKTLKSINYQKITNDKYLF